MNPPGRYGYENGRLRVFDEHGPRTYGRPCEWAADCGPETFLGGPRGWTAAAREAIRVAETSPIRPVRGMPDDFIVFAAGLDGASPLAVCGIACEATTLTVRFEDVWALLPPSQRRFSYACSAIRDPNGKDGLQPAADGMVRETLAGLAPDVRIAIDLADNGGFTLAFEPEP